MTLTPERLDVVSIFQDTVNWQIFAVLLISICFMIRDFSVKLKPLQSLYILTQYAL